MADFLINMFIGNVVLDNASVHFYAFSLSDQIVCAYLFCFLFLGEVLCYLMSVDERL